MESQTRNTVASVKCMCCAAIAVFVFLATARAANAATITVAPLPNSEFFLIAVAGRIVPGDYERFRAKTATISKAGVAFRSPGGIVLDAIEIGRLIRLRNFATWVPDNWDCVSACALAWLGGTRRFMSTNARIGFHAAYNTQSGQESGIANAVVGAYLNELGLPYGAVAYITSAAPSSMTYLTLADARQVGIDVSVLSPQVASASPTQATAGTAQPSTPSIDDFDPSTARPVAAPSQMPLSALPSSAPQLELRSRQFVDALYQATSGSSNVAALARFYSDTVNYFGQLMPRQQVLERIQRFLARWPIRDYKPIQRTVTVDCRETSLVCVARGAIQFDARSPLRNERSSGQAIFEYSLLFISKDQPPQIVVENGSILERNKTALHSDGGNSFRELLNSR